MSETPGCPHLDAMFRLDQDALETSEIGWAELREQGPVVWVEHLGAYVVTDFDAVEEVVLDHERFPSGVGNPRGPVLEQTLARRRAEVAEESEEFRELLEQLHPDWRRRRVLLAADGAEHAAHRRLVQGMFSARRAEAMAPTIRAEALEAAAALPIGEPVEMVEAFLNAVPMRVIADQLGIDRDHLPEFRRWATYNNSTIGRDEFPSELVIEVTRANVEFAAYFRELMDIRRAEPRDDFTTRLVQHDPEDGSFDDEIRLNLMSQMIGAGNETSAKTLADAMVRLARDPEMAARLRAEPELVPAYVEEVIRLLSPTQGLFRTSAADTEVSGCPIPAGSAVLVGFAPANRTPEEFPEPDRIVLDRPNGQNHLAFSKGKHFCAGAPIARVIIRESLLVLLEQFGGWSIAEDVARPELAESYVLHGYERVWVRLEPARAGVAS